MLVPFGLVYVPAPPFDAIYLVRNPHMDAVALPKLILCIVPRIVTLVKLVQLINELSAIAPMFAGRVILIKPVHPSNIFSLILFALLDNVTFVKLIQFLNALEP